MMWHCYRTAGVGHARVARESVDPDRIAEGIVRELARMHEPAVLSGTHLSLALRRGTVRFRIDLVGPDGVPTPVRVAS